jgi:cytochrome c peroxidase
MKHSFYKILFGLSAFLLLMSFISPVLPLNPFDYVNLNLPAYFTNPPFPTTDVTFFDNTPASNPVTNDGATLGRVLFYDKSLSQNGTTACGSCHHQQFAFADTSRFSAGFDGGLTRRQSMTVVHVRYHANGRMFWDERASSLETQVLMPFQDSIEMGLTLPLLIQTVQQQSYYPQLFQNAFGDTAVTDMRIAKALAQFLRSIVSHDSKYDIGRAQVSDPLQPFPNFTANENQGKIIFNTSRHNGGGDCSQCHSSEAMVNNAFGPTNNGLDAVSTTDLGVYESTHQNSDKGLFKIPTLRNIALTAPYMHDGRFAYLMDVVNHYSTGIQLHMNLAPGLIDTDSITGDQTPARMNFSPSDMMALVEFLETLTDTVMTNEIKWSDPFALSTGTGITSTSKLFKLYPNPANDQFYISPSDDLKNHIVNLTVQDLAGKVIYSEQLFFNAPKKISLSGNPSGIYVVRISGSNYFESKKVILL